MSPDDCLERLLDALHQNNYSEAEKLAQSILGQIQNVAPQFREQLEEYLNHIIKQTQLQTTFEKQKQDLIDQIMIPKK